MGTFGVIIEIGDPTGSRYREVSALVDTGASYTQMPASLLNELGVPPLERRPFCRADGAEVERDIGQARVRIHDRTEMTIVVFDDQNAEPVLGAVTLEELGLAVDPLNQRLIPVPGLLMAAPGLA